MHELRDPEKSLKNFIREGIFSQITSSLLTLTVVGSYVALIEKNTVVIGLLLAIPYLTTTTQIVSAKFVEKNRKKIAILASLIAKSSILGIVVSSLSSQHELLIFAVFYLIFNVFEDLFTVTWSSWTRDLIFGAQMGEIFSKRIMYGKIATVPILLLQIFIFERLGKDAFPILFFCAFLSGVASVYFLNNIEDVKVRRICEPELTNPLKNENFMKWTILNSLFCFSLNVSRPFFAVYVLQILRYPVWFMLLLFFVSHASSICSLKVAGRISDYFGNRPLFSISIISYVSSLILFLLTTFNPSAILLITAYILHGFYTSAPSVAFMNAVAEMTYKKHSAPFYALGNWLQDLFSALGSIFGGVLLMAFASVGDYSYDALFLLSLALSLILFPSIKIYREYGRSTEEALLGFLGVLLDDLKETIRSKKYLKLKIKSIKYKSL